VKRFGFSAKWVAPGAVDARHGCVALSLSASVMDDQIAIASVVVQTSSGSATGVSDGIVRAGLVPRLQAWWWLWAGPGSTACLHAEQAPRSDRPTNHVRRLGAPR
jgi:hypothetical protein